MWKKLLPGKLNIFIGVVIISVAIGLIVAIPSLHSLTSDESFFGGFLIDAIFILFPVIMVLGLVMYYMLQSRMEDNLKKNGIKGVAEILGREQTGTYIDNLPQIQFHLNISLPDRDAYQIEHKDVVSMLDLHLIAVGAKLIVFVDPNCLENILLTYKSAEL